jgi:tRNA A-37 threonylcarbamoyl transferase component Bud32
MYAALAALAAIAYTQRQKWLEALDRRFFRGRYDARRLLSEVVEEARAAQNFDGMAPRVVARIEAALHPEFVALLVRKSREPAYRTVAAAPPEYVQPVLPAESKLMGLVRLLGKPLEVPHSESGWLQQQLPHEETELLRRARIDLLVPVATSSDCPEALLVLGAKRSEEPYSGEDQDLLVTIAASLAILLEKPSPSVAPRRNVFEECPDCGSCYDTGVTRCARDAAELRTVTLPRLLEGRYRMDRRLGRGGMGTVYETTDTALERRVAAKVIREDLVGSAEAAERFRREARAAASFAHPDVVTVYDFGLAAGTRAFLVMELLQGSTLREGLQGQRPFSAARALLIMRDVCAALEAAHRRQLVHRDLKPENIFLVANESGETAKLLDFGLAKFLSTATQDLTADTAPGAVLGTLRYMSPEQWRGEEARPSWDLWALAVLAYEMLTGAYPFCGNSPVDWFGNGNGARVTPVAAHLPEAPRSCQELFERTFAQDAAQRPQAARTFLSELQGALR